MCKATRGDLGSEFVRGTGCGAAAGHLPPPLPRTMSGSGNLGAQEQNEAPWETVGGWTVGTVGRGGSGCWPAQREALPGGSGGGRGHGRRRRLERPARGGPRQWRAQGLVAPPEGYLAASLVAASIRRSMHRYTRRALTCGGPCEPTCTLRRGQRLHSATLSIMQTRRGEPGKTRIKRRARTSRRSL